MIVRIHKAIRLLTLVDEHEKCILKASIALGVHTSAPKMLEGDGKTPEGTYRICITKEHGRYGNSLGLSYPNEADASRALADGRIDAATHTAILCAHKEGRRPPWGTALGGEIYIHGGGTQRDWTQGCIALEDDVMAQLFAFASQIAKVEILP